MNRTLLKLTTLPARIPAAAAKAMVLATPAMLLASQAFAQAAGNTLGSRMQAASQDLTTGGGWVLQLLGYLLGEAWGRRELRYRHSVRRVALAAAGAAVVQALLAHGSDTEAGAALVEVCARALCAAYGGWIYHLQRAHVRMLVAARRVHGSARRRAPAPTWVVAQANGREIEVLSPSA